MCKTYPGPRCSSHTQARWEKTTTAKIKAGERLEKAMNKDISVPVVRKEVDTARANYARKADKASQAYAEYNSTPEGQERLRKLIQVAQDNHKEERVKLLEQELKDAQAMRISHMEFQRLMRASQKAYDKAPMNDKARIEEKLALAKEEEKHVLASLEKADLAYGALQREDKRVDRQLTALKKLNDPMKKSHLSIQRAAQKAYEQQGIPEDKAAHYALDTANSMQSGWSYLSADSSDRAAVYGRDPSPKVKGEGHEDHEATQRAADLMVRDEKYCEAVQLARLDHQRFAEQVTVVAQAKSRREVASKNFTAAGEYAQGIRSEYESKNTSLSHERATLTLSAKTYPVTPDRFLQSAYVNEGGSTNAYVLQELGHAKLPCYVPVVSRGSDNDGEHLLLSTGEKISSHSVMEGKHRLTVVPPGQNARKMFTID